jgi:NAD(P)-dependent dehydrogenase (short-subunit alcohol dehydrogenase family)
MSSELEGKIALVTGAGGGGPGGQGKGIAMCLAAAGADIAVNDIDKESAEQTAAEIRAKGRRALAVVADVTKEPEVNAMVDRVVREWGGIDILVNNVGLGLPILVEDMTAEEWDAVVKRNLYAPFYCCKAVIPTMKSRGGGKIISVSSMAGKSITALTGASYTAAKAGVLGLTRQLAFELGPYGINVNAICPAGVVSSYRPTPPEQLEAMAKRIPIRRVTMSEDIGEAAVFLASERARTITGISLDVEGGTSNSMGDWEGYIKRHKDYVANRRQGASAG